MPIRGTSIDTLLQTFVPYTGATANVDLGIYNFTTTGTATLGTINFGSSTGVSATATNGILTLAGLKAAGNNENLLLDFETTANSIIITSGTGANTLFFNGWYLKYTNGSLMYDQSTRFLFQASAGRFDVLNEVGNRYLMIVDVGVLTLYDQSGTVDSNRYLFTDTSGGLTLNKSTSYFAHTFDSVEYFAGAANDAYWTYDGTNMLLVPDAVGTGKVIISTAQAIALTIGKGTAGIDYQLTFDGETNDGVLTWMEDEDYFQFSDDILMATTENIYFRDTAISINSDADGFLDLKADAGIRFNTNFIVGSAGTITEYNNVATEGYGVPAIVDSVPLTEQTAVIPATNMTNAGTAGLYRVSFYLDTRTTNAGAGTISLHILWNDGITARDLSAGAISLTATDYNQGVVFVYLASGSVQYQTTISGIFSGAVYDLYLNAERVL